MATLAKKIVAAVWGGESPATSIEEIRSRIATLKAERVTVAQAPATSGEAEALLERMLDQWSGSQPSWTSPEALASALASGHLPELDLHAPATLGRVLALLSPLLRPMLRAAVLAALDDRYLASPAGLAAVERGGRLREMDASLLQLERAEEAAVMAAREAGFMIERRPDANPVAIMGLTE